jgi:hypothetical protein
VKDHLTLAAGAAWFLKSVMASLEKKGHGRLAHAIGYRPHSCCLRPAEVVMRYMVAWMLGVPFSVIVLWFVVGHAACGH